MDIAGASDVGDEDEVEVGVAVDGVVDAALLLTRDPEPKEGRSGGV